MRELLLNYLPAFVLGFIYIFSTFKFMATFKDKADEIKESSSYKKLEEHMRALLNENYDLKKDNKELKKQLEVLTDEFKTLAEQYTIKLEEKNKEE